MKTIELDLFARVAATLAESEGLRSGTGTAVEIIAKRLDASLAFITVLREDRSVADIIASTGLAAADFRRLESRIIKSSVSRIINLAAPIAIDDLSKESVLSFLAYSTGTRLLIAVPISLRGSTIGFLAIGFPPRAVVDEDIVIRTLEVISSMIAHTFRVEQLTDDYSRKIADENVSLKQELKDRYDLANIIGNSGPMRRVHDQINQVARSNATVLIRGESGTGTELVAGAIHYNSLRSKRPFIKVNCAVGPETVIDRELFGLGRGALGRYSAEKKGAFEMADGGTLFLDQIDALPPQTQVKVHRVLHEREFERLGGTEAVHTNVRIVASTTEDLEDAVADGVFREDLFYRINGSTIVLPPLRERKTDILLLAEHFLEKFDREHKKDIKRISTPAIDLLSAYHFPGNVRELENVIERAVIACDSNVIHGHHLPPTLQTAEVTGTETSVTLTSAVEAFERDLIIDTLKSTRGIVAKAAAQLDSTERILGYKIKKYRIDARRFRK